MSTIHETFKAWEDATLSANKTLAAALAEHGITTWEAALPHAMAYVVSRLKKKGRSIAIIKNLSGKPKFDSSSEAYEAARKAVDRIKEALVPKAPKAPATTTPAPTKQVDMLAQRAKWFKGLDKKEQARFLKLIGK